MIWANFFHCYQPADWDRYILRRVVRECYLPVFRWLSDHPAIRVTLNVSATLTQQLRDGHYDNVLDTLRTIGERGQAEFVGTAMFHPLLPLVPPEIAIRQIELQTHVNKEILGNWYEPAGFFLPEMAYSPALAPLVRELGYQWIVLDEISCNGRLGAADFSARHTIANTTLGVVWRNRTVSDYLFLRANLNDPKEFWLTVAHDRRSDEALVTAMDVESLGHHRPGLEAYWQGLVMDGRVATSTFTDYRSHLSREAQCNPIAASWASQEDELRNGDPYALWKSPGNTVHHQQWVLADTVLSVIRHQRHRLDTATENALDRALASDGFWWASAQPWWDATIVIRFARRLRAVADKLPATTEERTAVERAYKGVVGAVRDWEANGTVKQRQNAYLSREKRIRRMAGGTLTATRDTAP